MSLVASSLEGGAAYGLDLLERKRPLLACWLPEVTAMHGVEQPPEYHPEGDVWTHTRLLLEKLIAPRRRWPWARCCTTWASHPCSAWRTASASTATSRKASKCPARSSPASVFLAMTPRRWNRWWRITCLQGRGPHEREHPQALMRRPASTSTSSCTAGLPRQQRSSRNYDLVSASLRR